jgi:ubiquinone/menaquinone biosynthesis C-methylase UbiE
MSKLSDAEEARIRRVYARRTEQVSRARYSCSNPGNLIISREFERYFLSSLEKLGYAPLHNKRILEIGCGQGNQLCNLIRWGVRPENLFGVDIRDEALKEACRSLPAPVNLIAGNAAHLALPAESFDMVFQFTVFSSILDDAVKYEVAKEMLRVLKPGGCIVWYDFYVNNPFNPDVRGVGKGEIRRLFPGYHCVLFRITLIPPVARALGRISPALCGFLSRIRLFSTHYLAFIRKPPHS